MIARKLKGTFLADLRRDGLTRLQHWVMSMRLGRVAQG